MPSQDAQRAAMSRRSLLQGAATAGAAGLAATAIGAAGFALAAASSPPAPDRSSGRTPAGPIMVHVRDTRSGDIEVFAGTSQTRLRDKDLATRIARAAG